MFGAKVSLIFRYLIGIILIFGCVQMSFASDKSKVLKLASLDWEPYSSPSIPHNGYSIELLRRVFLRAGYQLDVNFLPWPRVLSEVETGRHDIAAPAYPSEERYKKYWVSESFATSQLGFFKLRQTQFSFKDISKLKNYRIGAVRGYSNGSIIDVMTDIEKEIVSKDEMNIKKLVNGRIDLAIGDRLNGLTIIRKLLDTETDAKKKEALRSIEFVDPPLVDNTLHVLVSRARPDGAKILSEFNAALKAMKADGSLEKILREFHL